ncbi:MAG: hypothetical protein IT318_18240 [Anaerolineales bacterium]|nr:hypothetical protein [Anaerolineales bacterium]
MSRLVNPDGVGKQRDRLMKAVTLALRELAGRNAIDTPTRDLVAFLALALNEIHATIDVTCLAWEKRDYWLKADQFRREWGWAGRAAEKLERVVLGDEWHNLPGLMADLAKHLDKVNLPKRNTLGTPWVGAHARLAAEREAEA